MTRPSAALRRTTIVEVRQSPQDLWRFHWHELFPYGYVYDGNGGRPLYFPQIEDSPQRNDVCLRLREALTQRPFEDGSRLTVDDLLVEVLDNRRGFLPDDPFPEVFPELAAQIARTRDTPR